MSILSWDDFEDDSQNRLHLNTSLRPSTRKNAWFAECICYAAIIAERGSSTIHWNPFRAINKSTDSMARASEALEHLDVAPGLEELEMGAQRVQVDDKAMINCRADLNQLVPFKYEWAWQNI